MSTREERLAAALADMFAMVDEGLLVRNIGLDSQDGWHLRMLKFMQRLQKCYEPLSQQDTTTKESNT